MRGEDGEIVATKTVEVEVSIRANDVEGETLYDYTTSCGLESNLLYTTVAEAIAAAREELGE